MQHESSSDRRRSPRIPLQQPIRLKFMGDSSASTGCLINVAQGGVYIRCATPVEVGREVACVFYLDHQGDQHIVKFRGSVAWIAPQEIRRSQGPGFGVRFMRVAAESSDVLHSFLDHRIQT